MRGGMKLGLYALPFAWWLIRSHFRGSPPVYVLLWCLPAAGMVDRLDKLLDRILGGDGNSKSTFCTTWNLSTRITMVFRSVFLVVSGVMPYMTTFIDVLTDVILVWQLMPHKVAYMLMAALLITDILSASIMVSRMYQYQTRLASRYIPGMAPPMKALDAKLLSIFSISGVKGTALRVAMYFVLVPVVSASMHVTALLLVVIVLVGVLYKRGMPKWNFCGLDPIKCAIFRSFVVGYIEAPCAIAFTTYAYLTPRKYEVGQYISANLFFFNLATSMFHVLFELWETKNLLVHNRGSILKALEEVSDLRAEMPSTLPAVGDAIESAPELQVSAQQGARKIDAKIVVVGNSAMPDVPRLLPSLTKNGA
jgi:hypothetical protein